MAEYTRKEFAALCHTTLGIVNTNVSRNNIRITSDTKKIDTDNLLNKSFFEKYQKKHEKSIKKTKEKKEVDPAVLYEDVVETVKVMKSKADENKAAKKQRDKENKSDAEDLDWDKRKKRAEALLKERQAEKALLSVKKMYGEMLPTDFVNRMFASFTKTIFSVFDNSLMNLAGVYCDELAGGDREALSRVNHKLNEELQTIINEASEIAKNDLQNEIKEYSQTIGKGESK